MPTEPFSGQFRSEDMSLVALVAPRESAYAVVYSVLRAGCAQVVDASAGVPAHLRPFAAVIRQCEDLERRFRFFREEMATAGITPDRLPAEVEGIRDASALNILDERVSRLDAELREAVAAVEHLTSDLASLRGRLAAARAVSSTLVGESFASVARVVVGVVPVPTLGQLARFVYRCSRGNAVLKTMPIQCEDGSELCAFFVLTSSAVIHKRIERSASIMGADVIAGEDIERAGGVDAHARSLQRAVEQVEEALAQSEERRWQLVLRAAENFAVDCRSVQVEKAVCQVLNLFSHTQALVKGQAWVPSLDLPAVRGALEQAHMAVGGAAPVLEVVQAHHRTCPTFFRTTPYTAIFQDIVSSYGTPRYKEINPTVFTIVTFPYLFGIMFGDMGHGLLLTIFAAVLVFFEKRLRLINARESEIFVMIFSGRYLLLAMGLFATYIGILYNDFFGFSVGIFNSAYRWPPLPPSGPGGIVRPNYPTGRPSVRPDTVYAFGIDVAWAEAENKLEFYNSIKMKAAVVVGVVQMMVGIVLALLNHIHRRDWRGALFVVVPEMVFLMATFGYMSILILAKWGTVWENTHDAPSLLETMTSFFLEPGSVKSSLYAGQGGLQVFLLLLAFAMVPLMLLVVPLMERRDHQRAEGNSSRYHQLEDGEPEWAEPLPTFDFSEAMIQSVIHTIEFVLGCVSNTASYLRLWALSLAHAQLSEVFFNFAFCSSLAMDDGTGVVLVLGTAIWLGATVGVLLGMESLSAFLHSLRLHWVEFQNKFYAADGIPFEATALPSADDM